MKKFYSLVSGIIVIASLVIIQPAQAGNNNVIRATVNGQPISMSINRNEVSSPAVAGSDLGSLRDIPQISISTPPYPIGMNSGESRLVRYSFTEFGNGSGQITSREFQFFTQYDVPLSDLIGSYPAGILINSLQTSDWMELVYLPKSVIEKARAMEEYAILLKTTFYGKSSTGADFTTQSSLLILLPPANFTKSIPSNTAAIWPINPMLLWHSSIGAIDYEYCFDTIDNNSCDTDWTGTYWLGTYDTKASLQSLPPGTTFYWQVRANNTAGTTYANNGNWWSFSTQIITPTLISPADTELLLHRLPTFDWDDLRGADSYTLQVSKVNTFASLALDVTTTDSSYTPPADLARNRLYYWRVRINTVSGPGTWSDVRSFTTGNPPSIPSLSTPGNNALASGPSPLFKWSNSTLPTGMVFDHYQIQIATDGDFANIAYEGNVSGRTNSQTNAAVLSPATTYYWRVRSFSAAGHYSSWSKVRSVRIRFAGPTLTQPAHGSTVGGLKPTFNWGAVSGATRYILQISKVSNFRSLVHNKSLTIPNFTPAASLAPATTYYWRVRVNGLYGPGEWSEVFTFTTP